MKPIGGRKLFRRLISTKYWHSIDLNKVLALSGLMLHFGHFQDPSIAGMYNRDAKKIYIEANDPYGRQAFTVAHEIGHYYLHQDKPEETFLRQEYYALADDQREMEQEANWFAASLLIPEEFVRTFWGLSYDVHDIATRFGVSSTAAFYRLKNLGLI